MQDLTRAQKARLAVQSFRTIANALALRGYYRPSGKLGQSLAEHMISLSPEIYGSMSDPRVVELKGLEYVIDRLPRGIEECTRIVLTEEEEFCDNVFERIEPFKRRRTCYRISPKEMCFTITRGLTEIYDILTHLTFLNIEAGKIQSRMHDESGNITAEWRDLEKTVQKKDSLTGQELGQAVWNLSLILGRPYQQTRETYTYFEKSRTLNNSNNGLFSLIYYMGKRIDEERESHLNSIVIYLTPSLMNIIGHQKYGSKWANDIKEKLQSLHLDKRPLHIVSANLHSVVNLLYGYAAVKADRRGESVTDLFDLIHLIRERRDVVFHFAREHGMYELPDRSGTHIDCQIIDTALLEGLNFHPELAVRLPAEEAERPVLLVMDYAFGTQAFEVMDNLLNPYAEGPPESLMNIRSISVMGKAGILPGKKGDIMLATAHVIEGTSDNYLFENDLDEKDFGRMEGIDIFTGPIITVLGTSLQNSDMLVRFQKSWNTVGLEMEGGHYQRAISAAIIKGHIPKDVKVRYAYYASDNPIVSGQTLAAGEMGAEGVRPTYLVTKVILQKVLPANAADSNVSSE
ncbi:MAG: hypothetical protein R2941_00505 [Desulfobacterales bacterium]